MFKKGDLVEFRSQTPNRTGHVGTIIRVSFPYGEVTAFVRWWHDVDRVQSIHPANLRLVKGDQNV